MEQASFTDIDRDFTAPPSGCRVMRADALSALGAVPDKTFRCCVTSPPYWGLRDYGDEHQCVAGRAPGGAGTARRIDQGRQGTTVAVEREDDLPRPILGGPGRGDGARDRRPLVPGFAQGRKRSRGECFETAQERPAAVGQPCHCRVRFCRLAYGRCVNARTGCASICILRTWRHVRGSGLPQWHRTLLLLRGCSQ